MKLKKLIATIAAASLLVACSSGTTSSSAEGSLSEGDTIKIGFIGPLTGDVSQYGIPVSNTLKLVVDEYNASEDAKYTVEVVAEDTTGDATQATTAYQKEVSDGVIGIVGPVITAEGLAVAAASVDDKTPVISSSTSGDSIVFDDDGNTRTNYFRTCSNDSMGGKTIAKAIGDGSIEGVTKVAILVNSGSDYSQGCVDSFVAQAEEDGTEIVATVSYPDGTTDFKTYVEEATSAGADCVFMPDYYETVAKAVKQFRDQGYTGTFCGTDGWDGVLEIEGVDKSIFYDTYFTNFFDDRTDEVKDYVAKYEETYGSSTNMFGTMAYDAAWMMIKAVEECESDDPETICATIEGMSYEGITGTIEFDENHNPTKDVVVKTIVDGEYSYLD